MRILPLVTVLLLACGCSTLEPLPRDTVAAKAIITALIPEGTSVDEAKKRMQEKGFRCSIRENVGPSPVDYLYGFADRHAMPFVKRGWLVRFDIRDGKVYAPYVGVELTGP